MHNTTILNGFYIIQHDNDCFADNSRRKFVIALGTTGILVVKIPY
jgi:hypothetical protein